MSFAVSTPRRTTQRLDQKLRTRAALLDAARRLVDEGRTPSVAEVADAARVSRATAYRYFPSQESLLVEVPLDVAAPTVASLLGEDAPADPEERAVLVHDALFDLTLAHEAEFRLFLRASLLRGMEEHADPFRGARRVALLDAALAPLRDELGAGDVVRVRAALSALVGTEAYFALRDVLRLPPDEARAAGGWAVRQVVRAARAEGAARHP
ncbi:MAG TPA: helix-turn-helix domain-containing protein [Miltoncostaea sp.]|nr:helix-turn-helix domain-containing protein [Miltoncostaea sp.]